MHILYRWFIIESISNKKIQKIMMWLGWNAILLCHYYYFFFDWKFMLDKTIWGVCIYGYKINVCITLHRIVVAKTNNAHNKWRKWSIRNLYYFICFDGLFSVSLFSPNRHAIFHASRIHNAQSNRSVSIFLCFFLSTTIVRPWRIEDSHTFTSNDIHISSNCVEFSKMPDNFLRINTILKMDNCLRLTNTQQPNTPILSFMFLLLGNFLQKNVHCNSNNSCAILYFIFHDFQLEI